MTVNTKPLSDSVGAEVLDVDRDRLLHDDALADDCLEAARAPTACSCSATCTSTTTTQVAFSKRLGRWRSVGKGERPEIFRVTLDPAKNPAADYLKGTFDWHIDGMTDDIPIMATVLSAHAVAEPRAARPSSPAPTPPTKHLDRRARRSAFDDGRVVHTFEAAQKLVAPEPHRERAWRVWRQAAGEGAPARLAAPLGPQVARARRDDRPRRWGWTTDEGRAFLDDLLARVDRPRAGLPPRVGGRRHGHLGQPRRAAPALPYDPSSPRDMHRTTHRGERGRAMTPSPASRRCRPTVGRDVRAGIAALLPAGATRSCAARRADPRDSTSSARSRSTRR